MMTMHLGLAARLACKGRPLLRTLHHITLYLLYWYVAGWLLMIAGWSS